MNENDIFKKLSKICDKLYENHSLILFYIVDTDNNINLMLRSERLPFINCCTTMTTENLKKMQHKKVRK